MTSLHTWMQQRPYFREDDGWRAAAESTHDTDYFRPVEVPGTGKRIKMVPAHDAMERRERRWLHLIMSGMEVKGVNA